MKRKTFIEITASLFILLFLYTAMSKLYDPNHFRWALHSSPLISGATELIVYALPGAEILVAALLFFPFTRRWGLWGSLVLMSLFTLYISYMLIFSPHLPCSCGGIISKMSWQQHLVFNIVFTVLAALAIYNDKNRFEPSSKLFGKVKYS